MNDKRSTFMDMFQRNHNTISVGLSLKCDDTDWVKGLKDDPGVKFVEFFFEEGTPIEKEDKHIELAEKHKLRIRGCHTVSSDEIKSIIAYVDKINGIRLKQDEIGSERREQNMPAAHKLSIDFSSEDH